MTQLPQAEAPLRAVTRPLPPLEEAVERVIVPAKRRIKLRDLSQHGPVIRVLAARDFKAKYKQAALGPIWLVVQPAVMLLAFIVGFHSLGRVSTLHVPYVVFALVGLSAWTFFQASLTMGAASIVSNGNFIRFTPVPRVAFPISAVIASLPSFVITGAAMIVAAAVTGDLSVRVLLLPLGLIWLLLLMAGVVATFSSVAVRYHDVLSALPFLLGVGIFFVPVGYSLARLSPVFRTLVELNPLTGVIEGWRWMVLSGYRPLVGPIIWSLVLTGVIAAAGWRIFARLETTMADVI